MRACPTPLPSTSLRKSDALCACRSAVFTCLGLGQTSNLSFGSGAERFGNQCSKAFLNVLRRISVVFLLIRCLVCLRYFFLDWYFCAIDAFWRWYIVVWPCLLYCCITLIVNRSGLRVSAKCLNCKLSTGCHTCHSALSPLGGSGAQVTNNSIQTHPHTHFDSPDLTLSDPRPFLQQVLLTLLRFSMITGSLILKLCDVNDSQHYKHIFIY